MLSTTVKNIAEKNNLRSKELQTKEKNVIEHYSN